MGKVNIQPQKSLILTSMPCAHQTYGDKGTPLGIEGYQKQFQQIPWFFTNKQTHTQTKNKTKSFSRHKIHIKATF